MAEASKESLGSKRAVVPMMMIMMIYGKGIYELKIRPLTGINLRVVPKGPLNVFYDGNCPSLIKCFFL